MPTNYTSRLRAGDRWNGIGLAISRPSTDWSAAEWSIVLRRFPRGPVIHTFQPGIIIDGETVSVAFHLSGADSAKLQLGSTYFGSVVVHVPGEDPTAEPAFGPYTLFTWSLEVGEFAQLAGGNFNLEWDPTMATFNITLAEGGTNGLNGQDGVGFRLGDPIYIHPDSRNQYYYIAGLYYLVTRTLVDGKVNETVSDVGIAVPV